MKALQFSPKAAFDLQNISSRIAADKPNVAERFVNQIEQKCRLLPKFPHLGATQDDLLEGLRVVAFRGYAIYYRDLPEEIRIERVLAPGVDVGPEWFS